MDKASIVLKQLEDLAKIQFMPSIGPEKGKIVASIIKKYKPHNILEIGTLYGYSAILMARFLQASSKLVTIELDKNNADIARHNIDAAGLASRILVITGNALDVIKSLNNNFDLLFLDAKKDEYFSYLKLVEAKLKPGSIIIADNVGIFKQDMLDFLHYVKHSGNYKSKTIKVPLEFTPDIEDAMEISIKLT